MFNHFFVKCTIPYLIFVIFLSIFCHTVVNTSDVVPSPRNETLSKDDKIKRGDAKQESVDVESKSKDLNASENKVVSSLLTNNVTLHKPSIVDDEFNSTAGLPPWMLKINEGALQRTGYVALGFMSIVLVFFVVRAVRLRQKRSKSRKYGIITSTASDLEMEPLDKDDDEEEDTTLFDAQHKYSLQ